ncbi:MAG: hypothetical protein SCM88_08085 [Bacillota bacterium]|nr:hypothetical protein [Bacillota bacterium]
MQERARHKACRWFSAAPAGRRAFDWQKLCRTIDAILAGNCRKQRKHGKGSGFYDRMG